MTDPYQTPQTTQTPAVQTSEVIKLSPKQVLFSLEGRIPRSTWWIYTIIIGIISNIILSVIAAVAMGGNDVNGLPSEPTMLGLIILLLAYIPFLWVSICISAKRCHDSDKSGWWMLVPIYGFILCGFIPGTPGTNRFGNNPLGQ